MDILKLLLVFAVIITVIAMKKPLLFATTIASVVIVVLYQLPMDTAGAAVWKGLTSQTTIDSLLVLYTITFLQRMMEKRHQLAGCQEALNGLFNNRRVNVSLAPFLLGCLPAASTVLVCGPIVRGSVGDELDTTEKAAITSYFRHISESFLPTYTSIFIAIGLSGGAVSVSSFVLAMLPRVAALFLTGYLVYLRRIPRDTGMVPDRSKGEYARLFFQSTWPIFLAIVLILCFKQMKVWMVVIVCTVINFFVNKFSFREIVPFFRSAFEGRLMLNTWMIMVFKELLAATGVITLLPEAFSHLPIPTFVVFALISFFGAVVAGSQAIIVLAMPMAMAALNGAPALSMFILFMSMNYVAMQVSPTHICLTLCAEDYKVPLGSMIAKTVPMVLVFTAISFVYYFCLRAFGL